MIDTIEEYEYALSRGIDPLIDERIEMDIALRKTIQKEKFGKNNREGNSRFYRYCLTHLPHVCENCGVVVNYPSATNISHILSRGAHPEMAHDPRNVNFLCFGCHSYWEHATTRERLKSWFVEKNERTIEKLKKEYNHV